MYPRLNTALADMKPIDSHGNAANANVLQVRLCCVCATVVRK